MPNDIKKLLEDHKDEIKRHFDVVSEDTKSEIKTYTDQIGSNTTKLTQLQTGLEKVKKDLTQVKNDVSVIKLAVQGTEDEKPLRQELTDLKKRVEVLETNK